MKNFYSYKRSNVFIMGAIILIALILAIANHNNYGTWKEASIDNQHKEWQTSNIINIITHGHNSNSNDFSISVFNWDSNGGKNVEVEPFSIIKIAIGYDLNLLKNIPNGAKVIIKTDLPKQVLEKYIADNRITQKYSFIIFSEINQYALVHSYFYTKNNKNHNYNSVPIILFNSAADNMDKFKELVKYHLEYKQKVVFYLKVDSINADYLFKI